MSENFDDFARREKQEGGARSMAWLRKALRLYLIKDREVVIPLLGEKGTGDDEFLIEEKDGAWLVAYVERGARRPIARFEDGRDAAKFVFWEMTARAPLTFQLDDCEPKPY